MTTRTKHRSHGGPHVRAGVGQALLAALLFGVSSPLAKLLLRDAPPQLLAGLLYAGSGLGLAAVWLLLRRVRRAARAGAAEARLTRRDAPWLAAAIAFGGVIGPVLLMVGLARTPASSASLLLNLEGVFTALLAWVVFRENVDRRIALGMAAIVAGGVCLAWPGQVAWGGVAGPLMVAGACACWAVDNNLTQKVSGSDPVQIAMLKGLAAGAVNVTIATARGAAWPAGGTVGAAALLGFLAYGVSLVLFVRALRSLGTARTGAYFSLAPFVGGALGLVLFRERVTVPFVLGAAAMAVGLWLHLTERHEHEHAHEAMAHEHPHVHDAHHQHAHGPSDPPVGGPDEPHTHWHEHEPLVHTHAHTPDIHHRHGH
ncbi:MAG TPA: DMT family transporter [Gemmatimonadaceae bacterium]|nr:DMT family transporter [Gemmatimonadaceae bacterium]